MAKPTVTVDVRGDTKPLRREIDKVAGKKVSLNLDSKNFSAPLGKIRGELGEFDKSLAASNARVLAFGASAGAIYAIQKALQETVKSTIAVEKALSEVNVILNTSEKNLARFGDELFNIAKKTGRSFNDVALAAGELARQGLGIEDTLKRTSDAMQLARLSGLGVEASVNAITAALNGFTNAALTSTKVIDKIIAVDQAFAVSGADLAEALRRVGSTAEGAGVSLDELLGIVTAAQQITARGGAVIGNSFKTIFTRIQRPRVLEALDDLGVKTKTATGASLSAIQVLKNLAGTFDTLGDAQKAQIAELVGGVFQINVLKASLRDLGSQYSIFASATEIATKSNGEAAARNAQLNKTLSAGLNETLQNLTKLAAGIGKLTLEPAIRNVLGIINKITDKLSSGDTEDAGMSIGKALLGGLGKFLSGPGLAIAAVALFQLFNNLRKFAVDAFRTFTGLNASFKQQQQLQQGIVNILQQNPKILAQIQRGEISVDQAAKGILGSYKHLNAELVSMNNLAGQLAAKMTKAGASVRTVAGVPSIGKKGAFASGYVPNFADTREVAAMALSGMYSKGQMRNPQTKRGRIHDGQGGSFMASYNGHEKRKDVIGPNGKKGTFIMSPAMQKALAQGYVPNFVGKMSGFLGTLRKPNLNQAGLENFLKTARPTDIKNLEKNATYKALLDGGKIPAASQKRMSAIKRGLFPTVSMKNKAGIFTTGISMGAKAGGPYSTMTLTGKEQMGKLAGGALPSEAKNISGIRVTDLGQESVKNVSKKIGNNKTFDNIVKTELEGPLNNIAKRLAGGSFDGKDIPSPISAFQRGAQDKSGYPQFVGRIFEAVINSILNKTPAEKGTWDYSGNDFEAGRDQRVLYDAIFGQAARKRMMNTRKVDAKRSGFNEEATRRSVTGKIGRAFSGDVKTQLRKQLKVQNAARGFIPNFVKQNVALDDAMKRENQAGVTKGAIRVGKNKAFANKGNPLGLAVTNTRDEPRGIKDVLAKGYVPNFVAIRPDFGSPMSGASAPPAPSNLTPKTPPKAPSMTGKDYDKKFEKAGDASGKLFAAMMAASMVTSTFSAAAENGTEGMKKFANGANAAVTALSVMGTAAMLIPGGLGLFAGAVAGVTLGLNQYFNTISQANEAEKRRLEVLNAQVVALQESSNNIQATQQALSAYQQALEGTDAGQIIQAQKNYAESLKKLDKGLQQELAAETDKEKKQNILGRAAGEAAKGGQETAEAAAVEKTNQEIKDKVAKEKRQDTMIKVLGGLAVVVAGIFAFMKVRGAMEQVAAFEGLKGKKQQKMIARGKAPGTLTRFAAGSGTKIGSAATSAGAKLATFGKAVKVVAAKYLPSFAAAATKLSGATAAAALGIVALGAGAVQGLGSMGSFFEEVHGANSGLGKFGAFLSRNLDVLKGIDEFKESRKGLDQAAQAQASARYGVTAEDMKAGTGIGTQLNRMYNPFAMGKEEGRQADLARQTIGPEGMKKMQEDAANIFERIDTDKLTESAMNDLRAAGREGEEAFKAKLVEMGVAAEQAATFVDGAGASTMRLAGKVSDLARAQRMQEASLARVQAAADAAAAAEAALAAATAQSHGRAQAFAGMVRLMAKGFQDARKRASKFNREFSTELLKGAAGLAKQFQTSFQSTKLEGDIKKIEINNKSALQSEKIRQDGNKAMFDAVTKNKEVASILEKATKPGADPALVGLANSIQNLPTTLAGQGAAGMARGLDNLIKGAQAAGGPLEGKNIDFASSPDILAALQNQTNAMVEAEQTRQHQLRLADLQTRLAQEQNRIDMQNKAGGGIKAFLDPSSMDKMESGFNQAVKDFEMASGRGDTVKTGQAAGNLLSNLNEFMGGPMMGEGAEGLKDLTEKGLAQSLRGRAMARADVLDQAAQATGNQDLAKAADALRNMDFAATAATQVATEFKRQKMPANIEAMLGVQRQIAQMQSADQQANINTATNTAKMAEELTGGKFASAAAQIIAGLPAPQVHGMGEIKTAISEGATAMKSAADAIKAAATAAADAKKVEDLAKKRQEQLTDLNQFIEQAQAREGGFTAEDQAKAEQMIHNIGMTTAQMQAGINAMGPDAQAAMGQEFLTNLANEMKTLKDTGISMGGGVAGITDAQQSVIDTKLPPALANAIEVARGTASRELGSSSTLKTLDPRFSGDTGLIEGGGISAAEMNVAATEFADGAKLIRQALGQGGRSAAISQANLQLNQAARDAREGPKAERDANLAEVQMLQDMINALEIGKGADDKVVKEIINLNRTFANQELRMNVPIKIEIPDGKGGKEIIELKQQVKIMKSEIAALNPSAGANPTPTPTAGNTP